MPKWWTNHDFHIEIITSGEHNINPYDSYIIQESLLFLWEEKLRYHSRKNFMWIQDGKKQKLPEPPPPPQHILCLFTSANHCHQMKSAKFVALNSNDLIFHTTFSTHWLLHLKHCISIYFFNGITPLISNLVHFAIIWRNNLGVRSHCGLFGLNVYLGKYAIWISFALFDLAEIFEAQAYTHAILVHALPCHMAVNDQRSYIWLWEFSREKQRCIGEEFTLKILQLNLIAPQLPSFL